MFILDYYKLIGMKILLLFCTFLVTLTSCKEEMIGLCSTPFEIKVGPAIVEGDYKVYDISVKNHPYCWWLSNISVNGSIDENNWSTYASKDSYVYEHEKYIFEKIDNSFIKIKLKTIKSNEPVKLHISLQSGNCGGGFMVN